MKEDTDFQIGGFLKEYYHLFAVMGVFGALSIYLNTMSLKEIPATVNVMLHVGIVSSLVLFVLVSLIILFNALKYNSDKPIPLSLFIPPTIGKLLRILFVVPFFLLVVSISYYVFITFPEPSNVVLGYTLSWLAMMVFFVSLMLLDHPKLKNKRTSSFVALMLLLIIISILGYYFTTKYNFVPGIFFFSSLMNGPLIGLIITPIILLYKKIFNKNK